MPYDLSHLTSAATVLAVVLASGLLAPASTGAAGNAIPDSAALAHGTRRDDVATRLPYRGAIGRIDRPILRAALPRKRGGFATERFTLGADPVCATPPIGPTFGGGGPRADDFIILLGFPAVSRRPDADASERATSMPAVVWGAPELHERVREQARLAGDRVHLIAVLGTAGVSVLGAGEAGRSDYELSVEYPDTDVLSLGDRAPLIGPARILVFRAGERVPFADATRTCADIAADDSVRPVVCIDSLYSDSIERCGTSESGWHPGACHLVGGGRRMSFAKHCFPGSGASTHPANCIGEPDSLDFIVTPCGTVLLEFDWSGVLEAGTALKARRLRGSSAVSRSRRFEDGPLYLPGREFLASLPHRSGPGDPHMPDFTPATDAQDAHEVRLVGVADKPESTLFFYPRMKVGKLCETGRRSGQACTGVDGDQVVCACDDPSETECACKDLDAREARYFECVGLAERDKMPCTRASHCWVGGRDNGSCSAKSVCVPRGTVWTPGIGFKGSECESDEACGPGRQCGYSLFELRWRSDLPGRRIAYLIAPGSEQRGVCAGAREVGCGGDAGPCVDNNGPCIGYHLEALGVPEHTDERDLPVPKDLFDGAVPAGVHLGRGRLLDRRDDDVLPVQPPFVVPGFEDGGFGAD